jgi:hypothetical protein
MENLGDQAGSAQCSDLAIFGELSDFGSLLEMLDQSQRVVRISISESWGVGNSLLRQENTRWRAHCSNIPKLLREAFETVVLLGRFYEEFDGAKAEVEAECNSPFQPVESGERVHESRDN